MSTAAKTSFVDQAPVLVVSPNGVTRGFGFGATSDSARGAALMAAVTAASTGDLVKMTCAATYHITAALQPAEGVTIEGRGPQSTLIKRTNVLSVGGPSGSNNRMICSIFHDDITLRGFSFDNRSDAGDKSNGIGYQNNSADTPSGFATVTGLLLEDVWGNAEKDVVMLFGNAAAAQAKFRRCRFTNTIGSASDLLCDFTLSSGSLVEFFDCYIAGQNDGDLLLDGFGGAMRLTNCHIANNAIGNAGTLTVLNSYAGTWDGTVTFIDQPGGVTPGATGKALLDDTTAAAARATLGLHQRVAQLVIGGPTDNMATGDAQASFTVPLELNGAVITRVMGSVVTAGTTGTCTIALRRNRGGSIVDVLSTNVTIDTTETNSTTAATAPAINTSNDDLATGDILLVDVDGVHTTPAKGAALTLTLTL